MDQNEAATLLQALAQDKVVVHVEIKRTLDQYESVTVEAWHTIHVDPELSVDDRIKLQEDTQAKVMEAVQKEADASVAWHRNERIAKAMAETEEAEEKKRAAMAKAAALKAEREANQAAQAAARDSAATMAAVIPSRPATPAPKPTAPRPAPKPVTNVANNMVPGKKIITAGPRDSEGEFNDFENG